MSNHDTPAFDKRGQAILLEVEPEKKILPPVKPKADRKKQRGIAATPDEVPAKSDASSNSVEPDACSLLAEILPRWALDSARQELSMARAKPPFEDLIVHFLYSMRNFLEFDEGKAAGFGGLYRGELKTNSAVASDAKETLRGELRLNADGMSETQQNMNNERYWYSLTAENGATT